MYQFRRLISTLPLLAVAGIFLISATSWIVAQAQGTLDDARQYNQEVGWLYNQGRFAEALPMAQRALEIRERILGPSHADVSQSLNTLALIYRMLGRYSEAEPLYLRSAEIDKEILGPKSGRYASVINNLGGLYRVMGRYDKAETLLRESLEIRRDVLGRNHPDYGTSLNNLALLYKDMGQYAKAEPLYLEALKISSAYGENTRAYALNLNNLAGLHIAVGEYDDAKRLLEKALDITKLFGEDDVDYARSLNNLAELYCTIGQYDKAEGLWLRAIPITRQFGENNPFFALNLNNLAAMYYFTGNYDKAEPLYVLAMQIRKDHDDHSPDYAQSLNNLATLYGARGRYSEAEALQLRALEIDKTSFGEKHPHFATDVTNLAVIYLSTGRYDKAEPLLLKAKEIYREVLGAEHPDYAVCLSNLAALYAATDRQVDALNCENDVMKVQQINLRRVFNFSSEQGMYDYLATASTSLSGLIGMVTTSKKPPPEAIETVFDWTLRRKSIIIDTLIRYRQAQLLAERDSVVAQYAARLRYLRDRISELALNPPRGIVPASLRSEVARLREESDDLESKLNWLLSAQQQGQSVDAIDTEVLRQKLPAGTALLEFVRTNLVDFKAKGKSPLTNVAHYYVFVLIGGARKSVRMIDLGDAAVIDAAIVDARNSISISGELLKGRTASQITEAERDREDGYRELGKRLYKLLFEPVKNELGDATTVYLAPDGQLNILPFEALVDSTDKYLVETYKFAYLSSGKDLLKGRTSQGQGTIVFADPDYDMDAMKRASKIARDAVSATSIIPENAQRTPDQRFIGSTSDFVHLKGDGAKWSRLIASGQEATDISQALSHSNYGPVRTYVWDDALEDAFKQVRSPRILHVSTHGFFVQDQPDSPLDRNPFIDPNNAAAVGRARLGTVGKEDPLLRSGLVLAGANMLGEKIDQASKIDDGWVTAEEISMMQLQGTELVVLSACDTGLGDVRVGEGVYGLRRAFQNAGAASIIQTLFKVPDEQSQQMMKMFYQGLKAGRGKLAALHNAQLEIIRQRRARGGAAHPFFWAGFVFTGEAN